MTHFVTAPWPEIETWILGTSDNPLFTGVQVLSFPWGAHHRNYNDLARNEVELHLTGEGFNYLLTEDVLKYVLFSHTPVLHRQHCAHIVSWIWEGDHHYYIFRADYPNAIPELRLRPQHCAHIVSWVWEMQSGRQQKRIEKAELERCQEANRVAKNPALDIFQLHVGLVLARLSK